MGTKLGSNFGEVLDSGVFEMQDKSTIVKIRANLDINNPIMPGMYIGSKNNGVTWIDFCYEKLPMFCFYYGLMWTY